MMPEIPKSARELLARQAAERHPSPDLLNGYVEQVLSEAEKAEVLTHLAACADCREIVFLAGGAVAEEQFELPAVNGDRAVAPAMVPAAEMRDFGRRKPALLPKPKGRWLAWALPVVALVVVCSTVVLERGRLAAIFNSVPTQDAEVQAPSYAGPAQTAPAQTAPAQTAPAQAPSSAAETKGAGLVAGDASAPQSAPPVRSKESRQSKVTVEKPEEARQRAPMQPDLASNLESEKASRAPVPRPPAAAQPAEAPSTAAPATEASSSQTATPGLSPALALPDATKQSLAKSALASHNAPGNFAQSLARTLAPSPWRVTPDGHLERVNASTGTWTRVLGSAPVAFRVVSTIGRSVWAGGDNGALYHSSDGGEHWNQVALTEAGTITSIQFDTSQQGSLMTDSGNTWATSDGGKTWSRQ
jgi:hypothetical protein